MVVVLMLAVLLSACGTPAATPTPRRRPKPAEATKAPEQPSRSSRRKSRKRLPERQACRREPVEISFMMWGAPEELEVWQQIVDDFQAKNPNIKVKVDVSDWDSYWKKLKTMYAGGTPPDVFAMDAPLYRLDFARGVLNLQPYIDETPGLLEGVYPQTLEAYKTPTATTACRATSRRSSCSTTRTCSMRRRLPYPTDDWTLDDLRKTAKELTQDRSTGRSSAASPPICGTWSWSGARPSGAMAATSSLPTTPRR